jgi:hypothetical protein
MIIILHGNRLNKLNVSSLCIATLLACSAFYLLGYSNAFGAESYSKNDKPFGIPLDGWMDKYWTWWITTNIDQATPKPGGCIINKTSSMVMLVETTVIGKPHQVCEISSNQGIMIPLWTAFWEASTPEYMNKSYQELSKAAREIGDLGAITSLVTLDGKPIGKLDVVSSMRSGSLDYKINSMDNVTELYSKGFNITIPEDTHMADQNAGTWRSGAHGWFTFLKPLPPGEHKLTYNIGVTGTGPNDHSSEITYDLQVKPGQTGNTTTNIPSNDTILNSNTTNKSSLNTTMPEQVPPQSINGSNVPKI